MLDIGCGRGEFLEVMRDAGVAARGIDLGPDPSRNASTKALPQKWPTSSNISLTQPDGEFDGIMSSQVVEHLPPEALPQRMVQLCGRETAPRRRTGYRDAESRMPRYLRDALLSGSLPTHVPYRIS